MTETTQQYTARLLGYAEDKGARGADSKGALAILRATVKALDRLTRGLSRKQLAKRPAPDKWSITEILGHLAEDEIAIAWRIRMILSANGTPLQGFNEKIWAANADYQNQDPHRQIELLRVLRESNLALLQSIPAKLWDNYGMHEERGKETLRHYAKLCAGHDINHILQIERVVKDLKR